MNVNDDVKIGMTIIGTVILIVVILIIAGLQT